MAFGLLEEGVAAASDEIKRQSDEVQQGMVPGANLLSKLYDDLQNGCPGRRGQIIGRAGFELITFYAGIAKINQVSHAAQAATSLLNAGGANSWNTVDFLKEVAKRAQTRIGGSGGPKGTLKHTYAEKLIERYQNRYGSVGEGLTSEQTYLNGDYRGKRKPLLGSVRLDVVEATAPMTPLPKSSWHSGLDRLFRRQSRQANLQTMSIELHVFLPDSRVPSRDAWQQAIEQLGFPTVLNPTLNIRTDTGFCPATYKGQSRLRV